MLVTPMEARTLPVHRWFLYPHSYSPGLVHELLRTWHLPPGAMVYDAFAGAGTTLRTAKEEGYSAIGLDMLPLSVLVSNAKVASYRHLELQVARKRIERRLESPSSEPSTLTSDIPLVNRAFSPEVAAVLARLRAAIGGEKDYRLRAFFLVALARLVDHASFAVKSGGWTRFVSREINAASMQPMFMQLAEAMLEDVHQATSDVDVGRWRCYAGDATGSPPIARYDAVITSPPYLNRHDYTRVFALEHALIFGTSQATLIALRRRLVRSHVEGRSRRQPLGYNVPTVLADILPGLRDRVQHDRRIYPMITGYFEDMYRVLRAIRSRLAPNGKVAFVLGDVRFAGVMLPVGAAVRELGKQVGLEWVDTWTARQRGNSAQQMKLYGREPAGEYVIMWQAI